MMQTRLNSLQKSLLDLNCSYGAKIFNGDIELFSGNITSVCHKRFNNFENNETHSSEQLNNFTKLIKEKGIHSLAYYISPHISLEYHGIYFLQSGISLLASYFENKIDNDVTMNNIKNFGIKTEYENRQDVVRIAKKILLRHELGHYAIDYSLTQCNAGDVLSRNNYYQFKIESAQKQISLDESICNANVARHRLVISNKLRENPSIQYNLKLNQFCNEFMDIQPLEYRSYGQFTPKYVDNCVDALNKSVGMDFSITDFRMAIRDQSIMNIPLYMVSK